MKSQFVNLRHCARARHLDNALSVLSSLSS